jgi:hypothetical protein
MWVQGLEKSHEGNAVKCPIKVTVYSDPRYPEGPSAEDVTDEINHDIQAQCATWAPKLDRHLIIIEAADPRPDLSCHKHITAFNIIAREAKEARAYLGVKDAS